MKCHYKIMKKIKRITFTKEEINFLIENYTTHGTKYCSEHLGKSISSIHNKINRLKLTTNEYFYKKEEIIFLKENYPISGPKYCANHLNKTERAIISRANALKIKVTIQEIIEEIKESNRTHQKQWRKDNPEKVIESQKRVYKKPKNKEKINNSATNKRKINPLYKLTCNIKTSIRNVFKYNNYNKNGKRTHKILGCSIYEAKLYLENQWSLPHNLDGNGEIWMNWNNHGKYKSKIFNYGWDIDHRIPISSAKTEYELIKLCHYSNLQPLCSYTNRVIKRDNVNYVSQ